MQFDSKLGFELRFMKTTTEIINMDVMDIE